MAKTKKPVPTFISSTEERCVITVRVLAEAAEPRPLPEVEVELQLRPENLAGTILPNLWHIVFAEYAGIVGQKFWLFIDRYCPEPEKVRIAVQHLEASLPKGLWKALFGGPVDEPPPTPPTVNTESSEAKTA
jgi:hypothetical protein